MTVFFSPFQMFLLILDQELKVHAFLTCQIVPCLIKLNIYVSFCLFVIFQKGFVEAHTDDGILEVFGLKQGWHTSFVMVELITAKHLAQVLQLADFFLECNVVLTT